jgi:hypothetical protein
MSASSWYKDFTQRLHATNTRVAQAPSKFTLADVEKVQLGEFDPFAKLGSGPVQGIGEHVMDWGGKGLDLLSRPGYAVGGVLNAAMEKGLTNVDVGKEAWEGFSGQDKQFFHPAETLNPYREGQSNWETVGNWVVDFLAAVGTDTVSYIPGAAIAKPL